MQRLWVPGPLPGMNEIIASAKGFGGRGIGYSVLKNQWTGLVANLARRAKLQPVARAHFAFRWLETKRTRDPDNIVAARKFVMDGLVDANVIVDDRWAEVAGFTDTWDLAGTPGVEVTITPV